MTCNKCHKKDYNKRKCLREPTVAGPSSNNAAGPSSIVGPNFVASPSSSSAAGRERGRPKSKEKNVAASTGKTRGRPKGSTEKNVAARRIVGMGVLHTQSE